MKKIWMLLITFSVVLIATTVISVSVLQKQRLFTGALLYANEAAVAGSGWPTDDVPKNTVNIYDLKTEMTSCIQFEAYDAIRSVAGATTRNTFWCIGEKDEKDNILYVQNGAVTQEIPLEFAAGKLRAENETAFVSSGNALYQVDLQSGTVKQITDQAHTTDFFLSEDGVLCFYKQQGDNTLELYLYQDGAEKYLCADSVVMSWCGKDELWIFRFDGENKEAYVLNVHSGEFTRRNDLDRYFNFAVFNADSSAFIALYPSLEAGGHFSKLCNFKSGKVYSVSTDGFTALERQTISGDFVWVNDG